jgi:hypothetical protein
MGLYLPHTVSYVPLGAVAVFTVPTDEYQPRYVGVAKKPPIFERYDRHSLSQNGGNCNRLSELDKGSGS